MAVNLQKGQRVDLRKHDGSSLKKVMIGLGWDAAKRESGGLLGLFGSKQVQSIDCDASVFLCSNGKVTDNNDIIYFGNLKHPSGAVTHMGDNLTGDGEGDDEEIFIDLTKLPANYDKLIFVVNIYEANKRNQNFGMIHNAFIRICDCENNNQELCRYNLSENYDGMTAMIFGEMYLHNGNWKFNAIGQATHDNSISELVRRFI
ncbi:MAG: TerD family protein [Synergistaceae bacterium]|nr:TerD family protein [Synergistaceae bacterium]